MSAANAREILKFAQSTNPMIRKCIAMAARFENTNPEELRETLAWLNSQRRDLRVCWCNRDIYTQLTRIIRKVIKEYA